jgi:hypothetical protein
LESMPEMGLQLPLICSVNAHGTVLNGFFVTYATPQFEHDVLLLCICVIAPNRR